MRIALLGRGPHRPAPWPAAGARRRASTSVVIADADAARAAEVAAEVGATAAPTIDAAIDAAEAVVIAAATPCPCRAHPRRRSRRGLPTFCEKPLAADLDDTLAVADEIERSGVPFQLGFQRRFDAGYREARRLVETGAARDALRGPPGGPRPGTAATSRTSRRRAACSAISPSTTSISSAG